jgi:hypothetical protein
MEMSSLLALNVDERAICDFLVGLPVQRHPDGKAARFIASNDLNAAHGLAPGPLSNGLQALFSESPIVQSDCLVFRHAGQRTSTTQPSPGFFRATKTGRCSDIRRICAGGAPDQASLALEK